MKIHALPCATGPDAWTHQYDQLRQLYTQSTPRWHEWTDDPDDADIIFLTNIQQATGSVLEQHPYPRWYPEKCFVLSEQWEPPYLLAGIYANAPRAAGWRGRFRTGSYALHHPDFRNPFIEAHGPDTPRPAPDLLASFLGRNCHPVRERLFALDFPRDRIWVEDTSSFNAFTHGGDKRAAQQHYYDISLRSKFILCPRGAGPNSIRLFEALKLGIAPVIISDDWLPCEGPSWSEFALFVAEGDLDRLAEVLESAEPTYETRGQLARAAYEQFFSPETYFNYLVEAAASALSERMIPERWFVAMWPAARLLRRIRRQGRQLLRFA